MENQNNWIHEMEFNLGLLVRRSGICRLWGTYSLRREAFFLNLIISSLPPWNWRQSVPGENPLLGP